MFSQTVVVIVILAGLFLVTTKKNKALYLFGLLAIGSAIFYILIKNNEITEHLQMTNVASEALQNVGSVYNNQEMVVNKLTATDMINITGKDGTSSIKYKGWTDGLDIVGAGTHPNRLVTVHDALKTGNINCDTITAKNIVLGDWVISTDPGDGSYNGLMFQNNKWNKLVWMFGNGNETQVRVTSGANKNVKLS